MISGGYRENSAAGLLACGGALGPVIPPSICMIVYGTTMGVSVPAIVLGGIYGGVFTPTEAAAVCVAFALILGICYRELNPASLMDSLIKTVETSSMVIIIVGMSAVLSWILSATGIPAQIASAATPFLGNKYVYIVVLLLILFGIGCLMETVASMLILGPILVPIGLALGMNDLHLAIVFSVASLWDGNSALWSEPFHGMRHLRTDLSAGGQRNGPLPDRTDCSRDPGGLCTGTVAVPSAAHGTGLTSFT